MLQCSYFGQRISVAAAHSSILSGLVSLHPKNAKLRVLRLNTPAQGRPQSESQIAPRLLRRDDAVVPDSRRREHGLTFTLDSSLQLRIRVFPHRLHDRAELLRAHDGNLRIRPHPQESWGEGSATHAIVARTVAGANDDGEFRHVSARYGVDELCTVFGDAAGLGVFADHETTNVLEEDERDVALGAELDEVRALETGFAEEDAVVADDPHAIAVDAGET